MSVEPSSGIGPDDEAEEFVAEVTELVLVDRYASLVTGARNPEGERETVVAVQIAGQLNTHGGARASQTTLWAIEDCEAFAELLLEQARIAREDAEVEQDP